MSALATLRTWRRRSQPARRSLFLAQVAGLGASLVGAGLLVATATLLALCTGHPSWRHIGLWLFVIELAAFGRSPLRFGERMASHALGYEAVTTWRQWLLRTVAQWSRPQWSRTSEGDVLTRALHDTDELQSLWVRGILPLTSAGVSFVIGDLIIGVVLGPSAPFLVLGLIVAQLVAVLVLARRFETLAALDRQVRAARGDYEGALVALGRSATDLALLGELAFLESRLDSPRRVLEASEGRQHRARRANALVPVLLTMMSLLLVSRAPTSLTVAGLVGVAWIVLAGVDVGDASIRSLDALLAVLASAERLDALAEDHRVPEQTWSAGPLTLRRLDTRDTMELPPGTRLAVVGPSGVGKTTWLESLAALGPDSSPLAQSTGSLSNVAEDVLRVHLRYVPAEPGFVEGVARDVVALGGASATVWDDLASVGLPLSPNDRLTGLSRGQRQRLAVVRALASRPDVLILDEPTSGLGSADTRAVLALLERVGSTVIVATHDPDVIAWCEAVIDLGATR